MAQTTQVSFRIDEDVKRKAEQALNDMGLTLSTAITVFLNKVGKERRIPFEITTEVPNDTTKRAIENARNGIGLSREFHSVTELMEDLNADD